MTDPIVSQQEFEWIPVVQTAIGTFAGFIFGLITFGIQHFVQRRVDEKAMDNATIDALKRLLQCAGTNTETLVMLKGLC